MISEGDVERVAAAARGLPPAVGVYVEDDFVTNLLATVVDFQMHTNAVVKALGHFKESRFDEVRTLADLQAVMDRFPDDQEGNTDLALYLWGYKLWTRAGMLRRLVEFFDSVGVRDEGGLKRWAERAEFRSDFEGRVKGLGPAVFQWLVMRQGVDTVKPDVHVHRFAEAAVGRRLSDADTVDVVVGAAHRLGMKAYQLDWAIWEDGRGGPAGV